MHIFTFVITTPLRLASFHFLTDGKKKLFQLTPERAAELQRTHGIDLDKPSSGVGLPLSIEGKAAAAVNGSVAGTGAGTGSGAGAGTTGATSKSKFVPYSELVPLKGIDVLSNGRYRVQLNTFMNGRKKFSRNSTDLYEVSKCPGRLCSFFLLFTCFVFVSSLTFLFLFCRLGVVDIRDCAADLRLALAADRAAENRYVILFIIFSHVHVFGVCCLR